MNKEHFFITLFVSSDIKKGVVINLERDLGLICWFKDKTARSSKM